MMIRTSVCTEKNGNDEHGCRVREQLLFEVCRMLSTQESVNNVMCGSGIACIGPADCICVVAALGLNIVC